MSLLPHGSATFSRGPRPHLSCCLLPSSLAASAAHAQPSFCPADFRAVSMALYLLFTAPSLQALLCRGVYSESPQVSLSHSSLAYAWTPLSQKTPRPALLSTHAGPSGASEAVLELGVPLLSCFSFMYLFSFSLLGPSPHLQQVHIPAVVLAADRKLYRDPHAPCTQDWKPIQAQRKRRPPG